MHKERIQEVDGRSMELPLPVWTPEEKDAAFQIVEISELDLRCREKELRERIPLVLPIPNWLPNQDHHVSEPPIEIKEKQVTADDRRTLTPPKLPMILPLFPWNLYSNYSAASGLLVSNPVPTFRLRFDLSSPPTDSPSSSTASPSLSSNYATQVPTAPLCHPSSTFPQSNAAPWSTQSSGSNLSLGPETQKSGITPHSTRLNEPSLHSEQDFSCFPLGRHPASHSDRATSASAPGLPPIPPLIASASLSKTNSRPSAKGMGQDQSTHLHPRTFQNISKGMSKSSSRQVAGNSSVLADSARLPESNCTSTQPLEGPTMNSVAASTPSPLSSQEAAPNQPGSLMQNQECQGTKKRHIPLLPTPTFVQSNSSKTISSSREQDIAGARNQRPVPQVTRQSSPSVTQDSSTAEPPSMLLPKFRSDNFLFKMPYTVANMSAKTNPSTAASSEPLSQVTPNGYRW